MTPLTCRIGTVACLGLRSGSQRSGPRCEAIEIGLPATSAPGRSSYWLFEAGRCARSRSRRDGKLLFAVNTPDNRLEIFARRRRTARPHRLGRRSVSSRSPSRRARRRGLGRQPPLRQRQHRRRVDTRERRASCARCSSATSRATSSSPGPARAARSSPPRTAARTVPFDPQLTTPGVGRADVWVFDAHSLGRALGGTPLTIVTLFTDTPRALAVSPDGSTRLRGRLPHRQPDDHASTSSS